jgi:hypothetical protein
LRVDLFDTILIEPFIGLFVFNFLIEPFTLKHFEENFLYFETKRFVLVEFVFLEIQISKKYQELGELFLLYTDEHVYIILFSPVYKSDNLIYYDLGQFI